MLVREWLEEKGVVVEPGNCAGGLEMRFDLLGKSRFKKFCDLGCSPDCLKSYLEQVVSAPKGLRDISLIEFSR